jgi:hypothetical protein
MSHFGVDRQCVHLETECHVSKLSQQTVRWVDASFGSKCRVVGSSVYESTKQRRHRGTQGPTGYFPARQVSDEICLQKYLFESLSKVFS